MSALEASPPQAEKESEHNTILIAVDKSTHSDYAFDYYMSNIHRPEDTILLIHCFEAHQVAAQMSGGGLGPSALGPLPADHYKGLVEEQKSNMKNLEHHYQEKMRKQDFPVKHKFHVIEHGNSPGSSIVLAAESAKASLIVMGTRGLDLLRRTILGSVSDYVVHHAGTPVLICHDYRHEKKHKH
ncbi:uncharacterized protein LOC135501901 [Lineus longissimus]|uniref:uncharacterized protein LOC135501901 n=1 Tax=Lineus longissimus TaxID=88925 RepID=UPI002B4C69E9